IAYEELPVRAILRMQLWGRGETVELLGEIRWMHDLAGDYGNGVARPRGYRYGIAFRGVRAEQMDVLNRICLHYAVPRLYAEYEEDRARPVGRAGAAWVGKGIIHRRAAVLAAAHFPLVLEPEGKLGQTQHGVTEDVSRSGMRVLLPYPLEAGTELEFR